MCRARGGRRAREEPEEKAAGALADERGAGLSITPPHLPLLCLLDLLRPLRASGAAEHHDDVSHRFTSTRLPHTLPSTFLLRLAGSSSAPPSAHPSSIQYGIHKMQRDAASAPSHHHLYSPSSLSSSLSVSAAAQLRLSSLFIARPISTPPHIPLSPRVVEGGGRRGKQERPPNLMELLNERTDRGWRGVKQG